MERINWTLLNERRKTDGEIRYGNMMIKLINEGHINAQNFSLKGLWKSFGEPQLLESKELGIMITEKEFREQLDSSMFPKVTGALINKMVQEAYDIAYGVGSNLVTVIPSSQKDETIVGFTAADVLEEVLEGMEYEEGAFGEKYHKIRNRKFGKMIYLTEEMVKFDQTGQFINRARNLGENAKFKHEEIIMDAVLETASTGAYASWRPAGTSTTLYASTSNDPYTSGTLDNSITDALADETDINAAITQFATFTDESGQYLTVNPRQLLVAMALEGTGRKIVNSTGSNVATYSSAVINPYRGAFDLFSTSFVDNKKGATYWFLGDFKKQFVYTEVFPLGVFQAKPGNDQEWKRDVVFGFKVRFMGGCGAVTNRYVVMSTGGG
jgi:phage major head subunit gpT-like protein